MKARSSDTSTQQNGGDGLAMSSTSNGHLHDLSILRKPIQTSITGFHEAMKAYNDGTDEVIIFFSICPQSHDFHFNYRI